MNNDEDRTLFIVDVVNMNESERFVDYKPSVPKCVYKYFGNIEYAIDSIVNKRVHLENPATYNDLYDSSCRISIDDFDYIKGKTTRNEILLYVALSSDYPEIIQAYQNLDREGRVKVDAFTYGELLNYICDLFPSVDRLAIAQKFIDVMPREGLRKQEAYRVSCFSECNNSILMWAYYANGYKGVCIGYNTENDTILKDNLQKVNYSDFISTNIINLEYLFRKSREWSHEQEWRIVCTDNAEYMDINSISSIIMGQKIPHDEFVHMLILGHKYNIPVYCVRPKGNSFRLELFYLPNFLKHEDRYTDDEYKEIMRVHVIKDKEYRF